MMINGKAVESGQPPAGLPAAPYRLAPNEVLMLGVIVLSKTALMARPRNLRSKKRALLLAEFIVRMFGNRLPKRVSDIYRVE